MGSKKQVIDADLDLIYFNFIFHFLKFPVAGNNPGFHFLCEGSGKTIGVLKTINMGVEYIWFHSSVLAFLCSSMIVRDNLPFV